MQDEALELYTEAVETCIEAKNLSKDTTLQEKLEKLSLNALERAETLKKGDKLGEVQPKNIVRPLGNISLFDSGKIGISLIF